MDVLTKRSLNWSFPSLILSTCVPHDLNDKENSILTCYFHKCIICLQNLKKSVFLHCVSEISMKNNVLFKQKAHFFCYFSRTIFCYFPKAEKNIDSLDYHFIKYCYQFCHQIIQPLEDTHFDILAYIIYVRRFLTYK